MLDFNSLLVQFAALAGLAAFIAAVINIGKSLGLVKDGTAGIWSTVMNVAGLVALLVLKVFRPDVDVMALDAQAAKITEVLLVAFGYFVEFGGTALFHKLMKSGNVPVLGKSYDPVARA